LPSRRSTGKLPLRTLLAQALVAFTIEFDNEFEHRVEHHLSRGPGGGVLLTSMVMWSNFVRLIPAAGVPLREVEANSRIVNLGGLQRWRYISVDSADEFVRLTPAGRKAQGVWRPLAVEVEARWRERFGDGAMDELREALSCVTDPALPLYLPVLGYKDGMRAGHVEGVPGARAEDLPSLLSQALLAYTLEYEGESSLSLAMAEDVVRVLSAEPVPMRELPARSGISKEAIAAAVGFLERNGYAVLAPDPAGRSKAVTLTEVGLAAQTQHGRLADAVERRWKKRLGRDFDRLARALVTGPSLALGLPPYPDGWRASRTPYRAQTEAVLADPVSALPRYPMVLHRGGWPDGN
jgi:DNA-binding MarR family transcriptional regulator